MSAASQIQEVALRGDLFSFPLCLAPSFTFLLLLLLPGLAGLVRWLLCTPANAISVSTAGRADAPAFCTVQLGSEGPHNSFLASGGKWAVRSASPSLRQACLSLHTIASFRLHAFELHRAVTQMSLHFPRVGSLCHPPCRPFFAITD